MTEDARHELQRNVQRLIGRCMLRIQQYERLMKDILANHEVTGALESLEARRAERESKLSDKSLGTLVKILFEHYVVQEGTQRRVLPEDKLPEDRVSVDIRFGVSMTEEHWTQTKAAVEELVAMRNDLVHHLIERFDVWTEPGCRAAAEHLEQCFERIDRHLRELADWAGTMDEMRARVASDALQAFHDAVVDGIAPDGSPDWPQTGIVRGLRDAADALAVEGWTRLAAAEAWLAERRPDQAPEKYGCRTWPQVLHESRQFDLQYRADEDGRKVAWFRVRGQ